MTHIDVISDPATENIFEWEEKFYARGDTRSYLQNSV
jgi:hypothetical protein